MFDTSLDGARRLDEKDPLKNFRQQFLLPAVNGKQQIYFLGNSLGLQPVRTQAALQQVLNEWQQYGVEAFFMGERPWLDYHDQLVSPLSKIIGTQPHEVVVMNQLTVNLHLLLVSFYRPRGRRNKIICEAKAFPSDQYMLETHVRYLGFDPADVIIEVSPEEGEHTIGLSAILKTIERYRDEVALVFFGGINYYTGQVFDMQAITEAGHRAGALVGFDLAHAAGNISLHLRQWDVDFAAWCSYKYLNSGPGAISGAYIHERFHNDASVPRFAGWWGYEKQTRFLMQKGFKPAASAEGWQLSTPSPLLYAAHKASLEIFEEAGWNNLEAKRNLLNAYVWFLLDDINSRRQETVMDYLSPRGSGSCQVSLLMRKHGKAFFHALSEAGVMVDWREPDCIRLAPVPLYNTFEEVWQFANILQQILQQQVQHA